MLRLRIITAVVMFAAIVSAVLLLDTQWLGLALGAAIMIGAWEWGRLAGLRKHSAAVAYAVVMGVVMLLTAIYAPERVLLVIGCIWWLLVVVRVLQGRAAALLQERIGYAWLLAGVFTLVPAYLAILYLHRNDASGGWFVLYAMSIVWVADIGAFFAGRRWGRRKLAPAISPGKSWEGVAGALVLVAAYGTAGAWAFGVSGTSAVALLVVVMTAGIVSVVGDLFESLLKRSAQAKDSSGLLPGHGGVLDRIDSLTAAMPVFAFGTQALSLP